MIAQTHAITLCFLVQFARLRWASGWFVSWSNADREPLKVCFGFQRDRNRDPWIPGLGMHSASPSGSSLKKCTTHTHTLTQKRTYAQLRSAFAHTLNHTYTQTQVSPPEPLMSGWQVYLKTEAHEISHTVDRKFWQSEITDELNPLGNHKCLE